MILGRGCSSPPQAAALIGEHGGDNEDTSMDHDEAVSHLLSQGLSSVTAVLVSVVAQATTPWSISWSTLPPPSPTPPRGGPAAITYSLRLLNHAEVEPLLLFGDNFLGLYRICYVGANDGGEIELAFFHNMGKNILLENCSSLYDWNLQNLDLSFDPMVKNPIATMLV